MLRHSIGDGVIEVSHAIKTPPAETEAKITMGRIVHDILPESQLF
jgi:hypothetical protein